MASLGPPHVRCTPMGRTCGEPDEIELTPHRGGIKRLATHFDVAVVEDADAASTGACEKREINLQQPRHLR